MDRAMTPVGAPTPAGATWLSPNLELSGPPDSLAATAERAAARGLRQQPRAPGRWQTDDRRPDRRTHRSSRRRNHRHGWSGGGGLKKRFSRDSLLGIDC